MDTVEGVGGYGTEKVAAPRQTRSDAALCQDHATFFDKVGPVIERCANSSYSCGVGLRIGCVFSGG